MFGVAVAVVVSRSHRFAALAHIVLCFGATKRFVVIVVLPRIANAAANVLTPEMATILIDTPLPVHSTPCFVHGENPVPPTVFGQKQRVDPLS